MQLILKVEVKPWTTITMQHVRNNIDELQMVVSDG